MATINYQTQANISLIRRVLRGNKLNELINISGQVEDAALDALLQQLDESDMSVKLDAASRVTTVIHKIAPRHHMRVMRVSTKRRGALRKKILIRVSNRHSCSPCHFATRR